MLCISQEMAVKMEVQSTAQLGRLFGCAGCLSQLDVARFAKKYPAVMTALLRSLLEVTVKYYKALLG